MPWFCLKHWIPSHINEGQTERDISTFFADARTNVCVCVCVCYLLSCVHLFVNPWTVDCWAPLPMESSRQEYWSGLPFLSPEDLPNPGIKPRSPA